MDVRVLTSLRPWIVVVGVCGLACGRPAEPPPSVLLRAADIELPPDPGLVEGVVPRNATLAGLLLSHDVQDSHQVVEAMRPVFEPRKLRANQGYRLRVAEDGALAQFEYEIDADSFLRVARAGDGAPEFAVEVVPYRKDRALLAVRGDITRDRPSLIAAVADSGEDVNLALSMADVLAGEIDFNSELQPDDHFSLLFEKFVREGEYSGYGDIVAAEFVNEGRRVRALQFTVPGEKPAYYDEQGRSLRRLFLRSPLKFDTRITSGFSRRRLHPILKTYRPHLAIDYGAPAGAPVVSVANGVVVSAGYTSGGGNQIRLRHPGGYETYYLHLSSFAKGIRRGARVAQGQLIGRVGKTGLATAPHLDYRLRKNGVFVNPLIEHRKMPPGEPVPAAHLAAFHAARDRALALLFGAEPTPHAVAEGAGQDAAAQARVADSPEH